jgi:hypothetical protein
MAYISSGRASRLVRPLITPHHGQTPGPPASLARGRWLVLVLVRVWWSRSVLV